MEPWNQKYDVYKRALASMVDELFDKKDAGGAVKNEIRKNK